MKMEAKYSSETSADFQRTTQHYIPEDRTRQKHWRENLNRYTLYYFREEVVPVLN
jgi:hypothetical protein